MSADKSTVELEIQGTGVLRGTVFKISEPGVPWPFAKGFINHHGQSMQFIADEEGNYELKDAPVGKINVSFINPNDRSWPVRPESKAVDVEAGKVTSVNFFEK